MEIKRNRYLYSDLLRILAVFGAIMIHVSAGKIGQVPVESVEFYALNAYDSIARFCVPIFVMISGMLFLNPDKEISTRKIVTKYIPRIVIALLFFGTVYHIFLVRLDTGTITPRTITAGVTAVFTGTARYHLWYLYMIIGLYLITPILRIFTAKANKKEIEYFLLLFLIFVGIFYPLEKFSYFEGLSKFVSLLDLTFVSGYVGYFILGYYLNAYSLSSKAEKLVFALGILSLLFTVFSTQLLSIQANAPVFTFYSYFSLNVIFMSTAVFQFFKKLFEDKTVSKRTANFTAYLAKSTFTMYLIHDFFLIVFSMYGIHSLTFSPLISPVVLSIGIFMLSMIFSFLLNFISDMTFYKYIRWRKASS